MGLEQYLALLAFAAISSFTPGPNNTLLLAAGKTYGFRRTIPMMCGVIFGFPMMIVCVGLGLGEVFARFPVVYAILKYLGATYMLWLAYKIATAPRGNDEDSGASKPMSFLQMILFQWVNPKGWVMSVTALSAYTVGVSFSLGVALVAGTFLLTGIGSSTTWAGFGSSLRSVLNHPKYFRVINVALALTLIASLWPMMKS